MHCSWFVRFQTEMPPYRRDLLLEKVLAHFGHHLRAAAGIAELHDDLSRHHHEEEEDGDESSMLLLGG
jgi:hypothetical protein